MNTTVLSRPDTSVPLEATGPTRIPGHIPAVLFASVSVVVGVLWDISWHSSIGRDTLFSPPHLAIYLGGVVAGVACGWYVLHTTFAGLPEDRAASVTFWKYFHGPLGAWMCIWGAFAMITSAPFDDWWHNAYGLDVKILSPPHAVLAVGILSIQLGALFMVLALQNRAASTTARPLQDDSRAYPLMVAIAGGLILLNFAIIITEYTWRVLQHGTLFYQVTTGLFVLPLAAIAVAGRLRWPATAAAITYTVVLLAMHFVMPLFPAEPKLAPVLFPLDRMLPPQFPLLLIVPALAIDLVVRRLDGRRGDWVLAPAIGAAFLVPFLVVQWPFAEFLNSGLARNAVFKQDVRPYMVPDDSVMALGLFANEAGGVQLMMGLMIALGLGVISARLGLVCGRWMSRVRR